MPIVILTHRSRPHLRPGTNTQSNIQVRAINSLSQRHASKCFGSERCGNRTSPHYCSRNSLSTPALPQLVELQRELNCVSTNSTSLYIFTIQCLDIDKISPSRPSVRLSLRPCVCLSMTLSYTTRCYLSLLPTGAKERRCGKVDKCGIRLRWKLL